MQSHEAARKGEKTRALLEERLATSEQSGKDAAAQLRSMHARTTAADAQLVVKQAELEEAAAMLQDAQEALRAAQRRQTELQEDCRRTGSEVAALSAKLGMQTVLLESKEMEIEELKAALEVVGVKEEAAGDVLDSRAGEVKQLRIEVQKLQGKLKTQVCCCNKLYFGT
jgi:chromosome segregation ATPase